VIACRVKARDEKGEYIWPRRYPAPEENLSEYLFCRKTPFWGEGLILASAMFISYELLMKVAFSDGLMMHDDIDWVLRAYAQEGIRVEFVQNDMPLVIWNIETARDRISHSTDWQASLFWIHSLKHLVTGRAYFSFVLTSIGLRASRSREWKAFPVLARDAFSNGTPSWNDIVYYMGIWLLPFSLRQWLALQYGKFFRKVVHSQENKHKGDSP
jgi:GT2 family glycosyltransferase